MTGRLALFFRLYTSDLLAQGEQVLRELDSVVKEYFHGEWKPWSAPKYGRSS